MTTSLFFRCVESVGIFYEAYGRCGIPLYIIASFSLKDSDNRLRMWEWGLGFIGVLLMLLISSKVMLSNLNLIFAVGGASIGAHARGTKTTKIYTQKLTLPNCGAVHICKSGFEQQGALPPNWILEGF